MPLVAAAGLGSHWGSREELLHPRDSHGRFRSKWKMAEGVVDKIMSFLDRFDPYTFPDDNAAAEYGLARRSQRARRDSKAMGQIRRFMRSYGPIQKELREGRVPPEVRDFDATKEELPNDLILSRVVGPEAFGLTPETLAQIEEYTGKLVSDRGYQSSNMGTPMGYGPGKILVTIATPAGTQAMFPGGREVILDRDTPIRITKVDPDGQGGFYVLAVAEPDTTGRTKRLGGRAPAATPASRTDVTEPRPVGTPPAATPQGERVPAPQPGPAPNTHPGTEVPAVRTEPVVTESIGGGTPEAPSTTPATPAPVEQTETPSLRQALADAGVQSPSAKRRGEWSKSYLGVQSGKKHPQDAVRDLNADIKHLEGSKTEGVDDPALDNDIESYRALRDLIEEHYGLRTREEEEKRAVGPEAPKAAKKAATKRPLSPEGQEKVAKRVAAKVAPKATVPAKKAPEAPPTKAPEAPSAPKATGIPGFQSRKIAGSPETQATRDLYNDVDAMVARGDFEAARDRIKKATASMRGRQLGNDDLLAKGADRDPDSLEFIRKGEIEAMRNLDEEVAHQAKKAAPAKVAAKKAASETRSPGQPTKRAVKQVAPEGALAQTPKAGAATGRKPTLDEIRGMKVAELRQLAKDNDVKVQATRKDDIADEIARKLGIQPESGQTLIERATSSTRGPRADIDTDLNTTIPELRKIAERENIEIPKKLRLKAEIQDHIQGTRRSGAPARAARLAEVQAEVKKAETPEAAAVALDKMTIPQLRQEANDRGIKIPSKIRRKDEIRNYIAQASAPPDTFKPPVVVPDVPSAEDLDAKVGRNISLPEDHPIAQTIDQMMQRPEGQLREALKEQGIELDGPLTRDRVTGALFRQAAKLELERRKNKRTTAAKKVTEALAPVTPSADLDELVRDLDPELLAARSKFLDRVREGLLDPKKSPAQVGRDLDHDVRAIRDSASIRYGGWQEDTPERRQRLGNDYFDDLKRDYTRLNAEADELEKLATRLKATRRKPTKKVEVAKVEREAKLQAAVDRQNRIDEVRPRSEELARMEEIVHKVTTDSGGLDEQSYASLRKEFGKIKDSDLRRELLDLIERGASPAHMRDTFGKVAARHGLTRIGASEEHVKFDPKIHNAMGTTPNDGADVTIIRPGYLFTDPQTGEKIQLERAVVGIGKLGRPKPAKNRDVRNEAKSSSAPVPGSRPSAGEGAAVLARGGFREEPVKRAGRGITDENGRIRPRKRLLEDEPIYLPNAGNDQGRVHLDSSIGSLWTDLYADDRPANSLINEIAHIGEDVGTGKLDLSEALTRLKALADRAPNAAVRQRILDVIENLDSPRVQLDIPESVPDVVKKYLRELERIPSIRKRNVRIGVSQRKDSVLDEVMDLIRKIDQGEVSPFQAESLLRQRRVHESFDGGVKMWLLTERLFTPTLSRFDPKARGGQGDYVSEPNPDWPAIFQWIRDSRRRGS